MKKDSKQRLFEVMQKVDPTFKPINENVDEGWKDIAAGGMMAAASMFPMKAGAQTQSTPVDNKPRTEITQDSQKQVYAAMVGIADEAFNLSGSRGNTNDAFEFAEIVVHYENLRDGKTPKPLSAGAKEKLKKLINMSKNFDGKMIKHYMDAGMTTNHQTIGF